MVVAQDRNAVDASLNDTTTTLFILIGPLESDAGVVHNLIETKNWDEYQRWYLFTSATLLAEAELSAWFNGKTSQYYVVLGGENLPKAIAQWGPVTDLLNSNGRPDYLKIRDIFLKGDEV